MKKLSAVLSIIIGLIFLIYYFPLIQADSATGTCGGVCPSECSDNAVSCTSTSCTSSCSGIRRICQQTLPQNCGGVQVCNSGNPDIRCKSGCSRGACCYVYTTQSECSASPSACPSGSLEYGQSPCTYSCSLQQYSCTWCTPTQEVCNSIDDDCDGIINEGFSGNPETCNNIDDNCNGQIDENVLRECENCGTQTCSSGAWGACTGQGVCSPSSTQSCGTCGTESCTSSCQWDGMCIEGTCQISSVYWADLTESVSSTADNIDKIKIITLTQSVLYNHDITLKIYESQTLFGLGILDWLIPDNLIATLIQTIDSSGKGVSEWQTPDVSSITYYYANAESEYGTSEPSWYLEVLPTESNNNPRAVISYPNYDSVNNYKFSPNSQITFTQASYDTDDNIITYSWDFDSGNPSSSLSPNPAPVTYSNSGPEYITLAVTDERGGTSFTTTGILIDDPATNQAPLVAITSPEQGMSYSQSVLVDATKTIDDNTPFEQLKFTWYFDGVQDPDHANITGLNGAYFNKVFSTSGPHSVSVVVDDGE